MAKDKEFIKLTIHDKYVKINLSRPQTVKAFLKHFATDVYNEIEPNSLQPLNTSFIDKNLKGLYADIVYSAKTKDGDTVIITIIIEHKSNPDPNIYFQLFDYIYNHWQQAKRQGKLPQPIVPIIFYHGNKPWQPKSIREIFADRYNLSKKLLSFQPDFKVLMVDINQISDDYLLTLIDDVYLLIMMNILKKLHLGPTEALKWMLFKVIVYVGQSKEYREALLEALMEGLKYLSQFRNFDYEIAKQLLMQSEVLQDLKIELNEDSPIAPFIKWLEKQFTIWQETEQKLSEAEKKILEGGYNLYKRGFSIDEIVEILDVDKEKLVEYIKEREK